MPHRIDRTALIYFDVSNQSGVAIQLFAVLTRSFACAKAAYALVKGAEPSAPH